NNRVHSGLSNAAKIVNIKDLAYLVQNQLWYAQYCRSFTRDGAATILNPILMGGRTGILLAGFAITIAGLGPVHAGLIITPTFENSISSDANFATIQQTINVALSIY